MTDEKISSPAVRESESAESSDGNRLKEVKGSSHVATAAALTDLTGEVAAYPNTSVVDLAEHASGKTEGPLPRTAGPAERTSVLLSGLGSAGVPQGLGHSSLSCCGPVLFGNPGLDTPAFPDIMALSLSPGSKFSSLSPTRHASLSPTRLGSPIRLGLGSPAQRLQPPQLGSTGTGTNVSATNSNVPAFLTNNVPSTQSAQENTQKDSRQCNLLGSIQTAEQERSIARGSLVSQRPLLSPSLWQPPTLLMPTPQASPKEQGRQIPSCSALTLPPMTVKVGISSPREDDASKSTKNGKTDVGTCKTKRASSRGRNTERITTSPKQENKTEDDQAERNPCASPGICGINARSLFGTTGNSTFAMSRPVLSIIITEYIRKILTKSHLYD